VCAINNSTKIFNSKNPYKKVISLSISIEIKIILRNNKNSASEQ
jgi:hypothetical protein